MIATLLARLPRAHVVIALAAVLLLSPRVSAAQAFTWQVPAGGETWTAGTSHSVEWTGGPVAMNVNVLLISITLNAVVGPVALNAPYLLPASWAIPANLPPGPYQLYIEDVGTTTYQYSGIFTVQAGPTCSQGCVQVAIAPGNFGGYPATHCGTTAADAMANAQSWLSAQLANACAQGWNIDNSSIMADYTFLPTGACYVGQFGAFMVEASAVACCCPGPTDARKSTWGTLKVRYR